MVLDVLRIVAWLTFRAEALGPAPPAKHRAPPRSGGLGPRGVCREGWRGVFVDGGRGRGCASVLVSVEPVARSPLALPWCECGGDARDLGLGPGEPPYATSTPPPST
jgi:hypothetical protein